MKVNKYILFLVVLLVLVLCYGDQFVQARLQISKSKNLHLYNKPNMVHYENNKPTKPTLLLENPLSLTNDINSMVTAGYLFSALCFMACLKGLSSYETACRGNIIGFIGMSVAVLMTFSEGKFGNHYFIFFATTIVAAFVGLFIANNTKLTKIPQLVATFHSFVGLAALFVTYSYFYSNISENSISIGCYLEIFIGSIISMITFTGSLIAALKLDDIFPSKSINIPFKKIVFETLFITMVITGAIFCISSSEIVTFTSLHCGVIIGGITGVLLVAGIGGADMPIIISILNSYSGWSTAVSGFLLDNNLLIISGALIGSSGAILSYVMCCGMNRSFLSVIFGGFDEDLGKQQVEDHKFYPTAPYEIANELLSCSKVLLVPGYGMAASHSQDEASEIVRLLIGAGVHVDIGIHPVAGRMPGHMNILLAEAQIPTILVKELETVNSQMEQYDIALIIGANDIVNPSALVESSKIYGMPVIQVWKAKQIVVCKRSMAYGYASISNELFSMSNTKMMLGSLKESLGQINLFLRESSKCCNKIVNGEVASMITKFEDQKPILNVNSTQNISKTQTITEGGSIFKTIAILPSYNELENEKTALFLIPPSFVQKFRNFGYGIAVSRDSLKDQHLHFTEKQYKQSGAIISNNIEELIKMSDIVVKLQRPTEGEVFYMKQGQVLVCNMYIGMYYDKENQQDSLLTTLVKKGITVIALDEVPRISRAQSMDIRSTLSNISGYRAVVEAFNYLPKISRSLYSAAGKIQQSQVLVIGVGVAGLQAIATAKGMGAKIYAIDTRLASKEEAESCGATFIHIPSSELEDQVYSKEMSENYLKKQRSLISDMLRSTDIVITSATIPGKPSPILITKEAVCEMKPGSIIVDLSSQYGGNCELTQNNRIYIEESSGVTIIGKSDFIYSMPAQSSELCGNNMLSLFCEMGYTADKFKCDLNDSIIGSMCVASDFRMYWKPYHERLNIKEMKKEIQQKSKVFINYQKSNINKTSIKKPDPLNSYIISLPFFSVCVVTLFFVFTLMGLYLNLQQLQHVFCFTTSTIIGYYSVWSVTPALHSPLLSVTNALSGVILIASMLQYGPSTVTNTTLLALLATFLSSINIFGGFWITNRMLSLFN